MNRTVMKTCLQHALTLTIALLLPLSAEAHRSWILPSATVLSGNEPWVTFDAAVSNDIFHADHNPLRLDGLKALAPDGTEATLENLATGKFRTVFDLQLKKPGTWKVFTATSGLTARWEENGQRKSWPPRGTVATQEGFDRDVPKNADKLEVTWSARRLETFVTAGKPSDTVLRPVNSGLELVPVTHPNDLFAGETATFRFLIDGKPAEGVKVEVVSGGRRYRNSEDAIALVSDRDGAVKITWPAAGQYWLEADYEDANAPKPASKRTGRYVASFEVLPQ
ncbi:MAG: DUF4198 domain-containing protein [Pseudomonadota bacterium]